jgi:hypothetical protein
VFIQDFVLAGPNGAQLNGRFGQTLNHIRRGKMWFDPGLSRPYFDNYDRPCVTINTGRTTLVKGEPRFVREKRYVTDLINKWGVNSMTLNATTLRKEEWIELDRVVLRAARYPLRAWADAAAANSFGGFNGMNKLILEHETMSDPGEAVQDMDGLTPGRQDRPQFQLQGLPLPITHAGFSFPQRQLGVSQNSGTPLDTSMGEACGRRVAESIEKSILGVTTGIIYGGNSTQVGGYSRTSQVYGYLNFPNRLTYTTMTVPTGSNPQNTVDDVLAMRSLLMLNKFRGPFMLYHSNDWDRYLDNDYARALVGGTSIATSKTLRQRLRDIEGIVDVRRVDFLFGLTGTGGTQPVPLTNQLATTGGPLNLGYQGPGGEGIATAGNPFTMIMVQMTPDVIRAVNGMDITTIQWQEHGGMELKFRVLAIQVPQVRADYYGDCGILIGTNK